MEEGQSHEKRSHRLSPLGSVSFVLSGCACPKKYPETSSALDHDRHPAEERPGIRRAAALRRAPAEGGNHGRRDGLEHRGSGEVLAHLQRVRRRADQAERSAAGEHQGLCRQLRQHDRRQGRRTGTERIRVSQATHRTRGEILRPGEGRAGQRPGRTLPPGRRAAAGDHRPANRLVAAACGTRLVSSPRRDALMRYRILKAAAVLVTTMTIAASAAAQSRVTIPAGTRLLIRMADGVDYSKQQVGYRFTAHLETNLQVDDKVVAPAGTTVYGRLTNAKKAGNMSGGAELGLELTDIVINGTAQPLLTSTYEVRSKGKGKSTAGKVAGGA